MPIDIICILVALLGFWQGYTRGIIGTLVTILTYVFGFTLSYKMAPTTANILEKIFNNETPLMLPAAFLLNLVFIVFILRQATNALENLLKVAYLGVVNQVLGGGLVAAFYILVFSVLIWFIDQGNMVGPLTKEQSATYPFLEKMPGQAKQVVLRFKPLMMDTWSISNKWMDDWRRFGIERTEVQGEQRMPTPSPRGIERDPAELDDPFSDPPPSASRADDSGIEE
jgi:uncharacterized membrane protein required for colicin V production